MAKRINKGNSSFTSNARFDKSLTTDVNDFHLPENAWTYARNAVNNTKRGDLGKLSTESANKLSAYAPFTVIGNIYVEGDMWVVFSCSKNNSEIGIYHEDADTYTKLVRSKLLNFSKLNLIKGVSRSTFDCGWKIYWDDGRRNPSRFLQLNAVPWVQNCVTDGNGCITCTDTNVLDVDALRLEQYLQTPQMEISKGPSSGNIMNGSYAFTICYTIDQLKISDYFTISNPVSLFTHEGVNNALDLKIKNLDKHFEEYQVVLVSTINNKTSFQILGCYSTSQDSITVDVINPTLPAVEPALLPIVTPVPDTSDAIYKNGEYLIRVGPQYKFDFNYQPLANQIQAYWQIVEYDKDYYKNGGVNVGNMRDEVYPYFIRWIFNTGDKTPAFHIPGRAPQQYYLPSDSANSGQLINEDATCPTTVNKIEDYSAKVFEVYNTAAYTKTNMNIVQADGGVLMSEGVMAFWESTEKYDDKNPSIWNASSHTWSTPGDSRFDLCGRNIRHHKFPANTISQGGAENTMTNHYNDDGTKIRVLGVRFDNIKHPVDNQGKRIKNIVGYEILRGSREGNKTVLYKGMLKNMREYYLPKMLNAVEKKGLYVNYPYNFLGADPFLSKALDSDGNPTPTHFETLQYHNAVKCERGYINDYVLNDMVSRNNFSFHSPDTSFKKPFLGQDELKIYGELMGTSYRTIINAQNHPKHKFVTDATMWVSILAGMAYAIAKTQGNVNYEYDTGSGYSYPIDIGLSTTTPLATVGTVANLASNVIMAASEATGITKVLDLFVGGIANKAGLIAARLPNDIAAAIPATGATTGKMKVTYTNANQAPFFFQAAQAMPMLIANMSEGGGQLIQTILSIGSYNQFGLQVVNSCEFNKFIPPIQSNKRKKLDDKRYVNSNLYNFGTDKIVNNLFRSSTVVLKTHTTVSDPTTLDTSIGMPVSKMPNGKGFDTLALQASAHYVALKTRLRNQYGQLYNIVQIPVGRVFYIDNSNLFNTDIVFGGDTYIGRYSEKNTFYYFNQWMNGEPNGHEFDYTKHFMVNYPTYHMNTEKFELTEFFQSFKDAFKKAVKDVSVGSFFSNLVTPSDKHTLDRLPGGGFFLLKNAYMYLFNSSVTEFFVESELNIDHRDYGDNTEQQHYPVLTDLKTMFHPNIIQADNYYKLDDSLSVNFLPQYKTAWSVLQSRNYNPYVAEHCFTYKPKRIIYSLPQTASFQGVSLQRKDYWKIFLPNNYMDFNSKVTSIKSINKTGAMILFDSESPGILPGVDELRTNNNLKLIIGDGGLFARGVQRLSNADQSLEYGSSQSFLSVVNTPAGMFWINLNQGKIFKYGNGLEVISLKNNMLWLNTYLPYKLLEEFPMFTEIDNPVAGIGCQTIYDNEYGIIYFCKKDFVVKQECKGKVVYLGKNMFRYNGMLDVEVGDPNVFEDASWTLSYDTKIGEFISFHDWKPDLAMSGKNNFITTNVNGLWKHNVRTDLYCNFYGKDYPFTVEFQLDNKFNTAIMRNVEYYMESWKYANNGYDRFHVLNNGFDEAVVYNSEQCSGLLELVVSPTNDTALLLSYPKVNAHSISIVYSKEEQQYRFNQFWDITNDRGEFSTSHEVIWNTESNGYIRNLNANNLNYKKDDFQLKRIRHNNIKVMLTKHIVGENEMMINFAVSNMHVSSR